MKTKLRGLLQNLGAVFGGLVLGVALCVVIPLAWVVAAWRGRKGDPSLFRGRLAMATAAAASDDDDDEDEDATKPHMTITIGDDGDATSTATSSTTAAKEQQTPPFRVLRPASRRADLDLLAPLFDKHGAGALHFASLVNPEYLHFYVVGNKGKEGQGSLAFVCAERYGVRSVMAVGDPLAPRALWPRTARLFLAAHEGAAEAFFCYCSREFAESLSSSSHQGVVNDLVVNDWGLSTRVRLPALSQSFKQGPGSRSAQQDARRAQRAGGLSVVEVAGGPGGLTPSQRAAMRVISAQWLAQKVTEDRELKVFCRALDALLDDGPEGESARQRDQEAGVRLFLAQRAPSAADEEDGGKYGEKGGGARVEGFAVLDPQREGGRVVGYVLASCRARASAHRGTLKLLSHHAMTSGALLRERPPPCSSPSSSSSSSSSSSPSSSLSQRADDTSDGSGSGSGGGSGGPMWLDLGLAPFAGLDASPASACPFEGGAPWMRLAARFFFHCADGRLYAFGGLAAAKARYAGGEGGETERLYCVHRRGGWLPGLFLAELYVMMLFVGFAGDGVGDSVLRLMGARRRR